MPNDVPDWTVSFTQLVGELTVTDLKVTGLAGAATVSRYAGAVSGAAPVSGTFVNGDYVVDLSTTSPGFWVCTVGGTPGTWVRSESLMPVPVTIRTDAGVGPQLAQLELNKITAGGNVGIHYTDAGVRKWFVGKDSTNALNLFNTALATSALLFDTGTNIGTFGAEARAPDFAPSGLAGAVNASRIVGATGGGPPTAGTFAVGDVVVDRLWGIEWVCTTAGSPGSWHPAGFATIGQTVSGVASVRFPASGSLPTYFSFARLDYDNLRSDVAAINAVFVQLFCNDDTGANYDTQVSNLSGAANTWIGAASFSVASPRVGVAPAANTPAAQVNNGEVVFGDYNLVIRHTYRARCDRNDADQAVGTELDQVVYHPGTAAAITSILFQPQSGNISGRFRLSLF